MIISMCTKLTETIYNSSGGETTTSKQSHRNSERKCISLVLRHQQGCATYKLKQFAKENVNEFPIGSQIIMKDFYVDESVTSIGNMNDAIQLAQKDLCYQGTETTQVYV